MAAVLARISTITDKGQTTVPKPVRDILGLDPGDHIAFLVDETGEVYVRRADDEHTDPAIAPFLALLARDLQQKPEMIAALTPALASRIAELVEGVEVDFEEVIEGEVAL